MQGFQLWVNLPAARKMSEPRYQEFPAERLARGAVAPGVEATVIAGSLGGLTGPVVGIDVAPLYADLRFASDAALELPVPAGHTVCVYCFDGAIAIDSVAVPRGNLAVLGDAGTRVALKASGEGAAAMLLAAAPIGESIVRYGPFVMNSREEIQQALEDYMRGRL